MSWFTWGGKSFDPKQDIPDLSGKVVLVTGGNTGLGYETALALAAHNPAKIYLCGRSVQKLTTAITSIKASVPTAALEYLECDLTSLSSVSTAAKAFIAQCTRLDILFLNAGIMAVPAGLTSEGYEIQFGTNHVGHALLAKLLLPTLLQTAQSSDSDVRIISLTSDGQKLAPPTGIVFDDLKTKQEALGTWTRYGQSKLANILYVRALARRYPTITSVSVHPGMVQTGLADSFAETYPLFKIVNEWLVPWIASPPAAGAKNQLWAATAPRGEVESGELYHPVGRRRGDSKLSMDDALAERLWMWTEEELKGYGL